MADSSTASLPYVAVARGHLIQAQVHAADGNAGLIAASILQRLPRGAAHSFAYDDGHTFHFSGDAAAGGVVFLCAEKGLGAGPAFAFLERCRRRYEQTQSEALPLKSFLKRFEGELAHSLSEGGSRMCRLSVADEGEGIGPDHLPRLTERFYRVDSGRSRAMGGTGLGLAIVKHIVERHRGRLDVASVLGKGTTVTVLLPLMNEAEAGQV